MVWPQIWEEGLSENNQWESKIVQLYNVWRLPQSFLLDREGKIVAKDLRGKAVEEAIAALLNK